VIIRAVVLFCPNQTTASSWKAIMPKTASSNPGPTSVKELRRAIDVVEKHETRAAQYRVATFLVDHFWGKPENAVDGVGVAEALGVLLASWNMAFYRFSPFDYKCLEECLAKNETLIGDFRERDILSYDPADDDDRIRAIFDDFLRALACCRGKVKGKTSPIAAAKALHMLAPKFFPLWDKKIAKAYRCNYATEPAKKYLRFMRKTKEIAENLAGDVEVGAKTLLKMIDEYNYTKYAKPDWE
ncbi:MAG TPA: hypothetical protein VFI31_17925, partial [Pirellulales bacterium]|nr:hypothetical protein [Pirellulales bacterium]